MPTTWVTSDTHFGHRNIWLPEYCPGRTSWFDIAGGVRAHDEALIARWNATVAPGDLVIHCGDFSFGGSKLVTATRQSLNGDLWIVRGNHDFGDRSLRSWRSAVACRPYDVASYGLRLRVGKKLCIVHHIPLVGDFPTFGFSPAEAEEADELWHGHIHDRPYVPPTTKHRAFGIDTRPGEPFVKLPASVWLEGTIDNPPGLAQDSATADDRRKAGGM